MRIYKVYADGKNYVASAWNQIDLLNRVITELGQPKHIKVSEIQVRVLPRL